MRLTWCGNPNALTKEYLALVDDDGSMVYSREVSAGQLQREG